MTGTVLRLREATLSPGPDAPLIMGVVNASPESFSDGASSATLDRQLARAQALVEAGAHLLDVGGESGVTNRPPISAEEEIDRILPLVKELVGAGCLVSVDTWKAPVAAAALEAGAHLINDVSGLREPEIADHCAAAGAGLVIMHTRAVPKVKAFPVYEDVTADVIRFLEEKIALATAHGVGLEHIVVDPGPDFAKTPAQTVTVLRQLPELARFRRPILLAVSRKDFVGALTGRRPSARLAGTLAAIAEGVDAGASILRVHDVADVADFLKVRAGLRGYADVPADLALPEHLRREPTP
ncbi:MAG: dihydropteroate synthase [Actinomycetota bacterium]